MQCIHPKVNPLASTSKNKTPSTSSDINHSCSKLNTERKCIYRNTLDEHGPDWHPPAPHQKAGDDSQPVRDMEDLVSAGKECRVCPFYYTRGLISKAEILFVPYNYLFDREARETTLAEVDFANSVLIFDEGV
jgi:regulator of telomere elongation helicase 1